MRIYSRPWPVTAIFRGEIYKLLRENYGQFRKYLPRVQVYYAVKANSAPEIVRPSGESPVSLALRSSI